LETPKLFSPTPKKNIKNAHTTTLVLFQTLISNNDKGFVRQCGLALYIKKYLKANEEKELWKLKYFTMQKYY
jgi:hypothetical protein